MLKKLPLFIFGCFLLVSMVSCSNSSNDKASCHGDAKDMKDFADKKDFQEAHELKEDIPFEAKGKMMEFPSADGKTGSAYVLEGAEDNTNYLFVIHEWWGLNDHIKQEAERLQAELGGYVTAVFQTLRSQRRLSTVAGLFGQFVRGDVYQTAVLPPHPRYCPQYQTRLVSTTQHAWLRLSSLPTPQVQD